MTGQIFNRSGKILTALFVVTAACAPFPVDMKSDNEAGTTSASSADSVRPSKIGRVPATDRPVRPKDQNVSKRGLQDDTATSLMPSSFAPDTSDLPAQRSQRSEEPPSLAVPQQRQDGQYVTDEIRTAQHAADEPGGPETGGENVVRIPLHDVFFGFDSVAIDEASKATLSTDANLVKDTTVRRVVVEGHCDDRGSSAYNLVLGEKRALAIHNYLTELGIDSSDIETVSYGEERPFCLDSNESCHQQNRRGHIWMDAQGNAETLSRLAP